MIRRSWGHDRRVHLLAEVSVPEDAVHPRAAPRGRPARASRWRRAFELAGWLWSWRLAGNLLGQTRAPRAVPRRDRERTDRLRPSLIVVAVETTKTPQLSRSPRGMASQAALSGFTARGLTGWHRRRSQVSGRRYRSITSRPTVWQKDFLEPVLDTGESKWKGRKCEASGDSPG